MGALPALPEYGYICQWCCAYSLKRCRVAPLGFKFGHFLLPQSCINQIKLRTSNFVKNLKIFLCTVLCQRVSASSALPSYHRYHFWIAKEHTVMSQFWHITPWFIWRIYYLQAEKMSSAHKCLKQSCFKTQLSFNIHYTYMQLRF